MLKSLAPYFFSTLIILLSQQTFAVVIDFELPSDSPFPPEGFTVSHAVKWGVRTWENSGYLSVKEYTNSNFYAWGYGWGSFYLAGEPYETFDLNSFVVASAWGEQTLLIQGLNDGVLLYNESVYTTTSAQLFLADWVGIDQLVINPLGDFISSNNPNGDGPHWVIDNLTINAGREVPLPASIWLFFVAVSGLILLKKKA